MKEYLTELAFLVDTAGGVPDRQFTQNLPYPDPKTYLGSGKLNEVRDYVAENKIDLVISRHARAHQAVDSIQVGNHHPVELPSMA